MEAYIKIKFEDRYSHNKQEMRVCLNRLILYKEDAIDQEQKKDTIYYVSIAGAKTLTYQITEESYKQIEEFLQQFMDDSMN